MEPSQSTRARPFIGIAICVLFLAAGETHAAKPTFPTEPPPETVCYCHNVNHHPHTVCTADRAFQMGHQKHVNNGIDALGECIEPACGNGVLEGDEACDDNNVVTEPCDYGQTSCTVCAEDCTEQPGATSFCGDETTDTVNGEQCDDGGTADGDGCSATCQIEVASECGNLAVEGNEQCECEDKSQQCGVERIQSPNNCPGGETVLCVQCLCVTD